MILSRILGLLAAIAVLASCASEPPSKFRGYEGPEITEIRVYKAEREMELWHHDRLIRSFTVELGYPNGHKQQEGDRRTPEGRYYIDRRNPNSRFHLSLGISYPNAEDRARARARGVSPGGDIFIHGRGPEFPHAFGDWTNGCIAVSDREMEDIYAMVRVGTPIEILAGRPEPFVKEPMLALAGGDAQVFSDLPHDAVAPVGVDPVPVPPLPQADDTEATVQPVEPGTDAVPFSIDADNNGGNGAFLPQQY